VLIHYVSTLLVDKTGNHFCLLRRSLLIFG